MSNRDHQLALAIKLFGRYRTIPPSGFYDFYDVGLLYNEATAEVAYDKATVYFDDFVHEMTVRRERNGGGDRYTIIAEMKNGPIIDPSNPQSEPATSADNEAAEHQERPNPTPARSRSSSPVNPRLAAALDYAANRGWDVFPADISFDEETRKFNKKSYKSAEHSGGAKWGKTRDPKQIKKDFKRWPQANVGLPTGKDNGFWVTETDTPKGHNVDGEASLRA